MPLSEDTAVLHTLPFVGKVANEVLIGEVHEYGVLEMNRCNISYSYVCRCTDNAVHSVVLPFGRGTLHKPVASNCSNTVVHK